MHSVDDKSTKSHRPEMVYFKISRHSWYVTKIITVVLSITTLIIGLYLGIKAGDFSEKILLVIFIACPTTALGTCWSLSALIAIVSHTIVKPSSWQPMDVDDWGAAIGSLIFGIGNLGVAVALVLQPILGLQLFR